MRQILKGPIICGTFLLLWTWQVAGQWQRNGIPICTDGKIQQRPQIITDGLGGAFIIWEDERDNLCSPCWDIYFQHIDSSGSRQFQLCGIPIVKVIGWQNNFKAVSDGSGGFFIAWSDTRNSRTDLYAQHILSSGSEAWTANGILVRQSVSSDYQFGITQSGGELFVAYTIGVGNRTTNVCIQKIASDGSMQWGNGKVIYVGTDYPYINDAAPDYSGGFYVVWHFDKNTGTGLDLGMQRVNSNGDTLWSGNSGKVVCNASGTQEKAMLCSSDDGKVFVGWWDHRSGGGGTQVDVYAQALDTSGLILWNSNGKGIATAQNKQQLRSVLNSASGNAIFIWDDNRDSKNAFDVYAARVDDANGGIVWSTPVVSIGANQNGASAIKDGSGGCFVSWLDSRNPGRGCYAQKVSANGQLIWRYDGVLLGTVSIGSIYSTSTTVDNSGGLITCWDYASDPYINRIYSGGYTLPVELKNLHASVTNEGVVLTWETESERNNFGFEIQRSRSDESWVKIGFVEGRGTTILHQEYRFIDQSLKGKNKNEDIRYRLKQIDFDGTVNYSNTITIYSDRIGNEDRFELGQNFPNPFSRRTSIPIKLRQTERISLKVHDLLGREIKTIYSNEIDAGSRTIEFDAFELQSGCYIYSLNVAGKTLKKMMSLVKNGNN